MAKALVIVTDMRYLAGMAQMARPCGHVTAAAVASEEVSLRSAASGFDEVAHFEVAGAVPAVALANTVAQWAQGEGFDLVVCNDSPAARVLLGAVAGAIGASVLGEVTKAAPVGGGFDVQCKVAGGIAVQNAHVEGPLAVVFAGADSPLAEGAVAQAPITRMEAQPSDVRIVGHVLPAEGTVDLSEAARIVGIGRGVRSADDLPAIEQLAETLGASMACTLPISEDSHWYPGEQVLGSSHNSASPELYLALGVSGSPNHLSGVKDAGTVVAVNNDPDAEVFKHCDYGIVCDLYEFVPALKAALVG